MSRFEAIEVDLLEDGTVLRLLLSQPPGNVLTLAMARELTAALEEHRDRPELRLVVLRGAGGNFSYGASVEEHRKELAPEMLRGFHRLLGQLAGYPVPCAALVEGSCLGGGFELALCCHFLFAAEGARFGCPEIKLGVFPPLLAAVGSHRLGSLVAERLLLTGETLDAAAAERLGFLAAPTARGDLEEAVLGWYRKRLRPLSAFALRQGTRAVRSASGWLTVLAKSLEATEQQYLEELLPSHDGNEGIAAFLEKRRPEWSDS